VIDHRGGQGLAPIAPRRGNSRRLFGLGKYEVVLVSDSFYRSDQRPLRNVFVEILSDALQDARVG